ncbi:unnamed protein product [Urochloa humidicola]
MAEGGAHSAAAAMEQSTALAVVDTSPALEAMQQKMSLALVATPIWPLDRAISVRDIYRAVETRIGIKSLPADIVAYPPDFVLYFDTSQTRDLVASTPVLQDGNIAMSLRQWDPNYRNYTVPWNTKVEILVTGIPPHAFHPDILKPLLSSYCDIRSHHFNRYKGICRVTAYAAGPTTIPTKGAVAFKKIKPHYTDLQTFAVTISAQALPPETNTCNSTEPANSVPEQECSVRGPAKPEHPLSPEKKDTPTEMLPFDKLDFKYYGARLLHTAYDLDVDPGVLLELYEEQAIDEDRRLGIKRPGDGSDTDDSYLYHDDDNYSPSDDLSDREPMDWKGSNI